MWNKKYLKKKGFFNATNAERLHIKCKENVFRN